MRSTEIDRVLAELSLEGSFIQQVSQPDYRNLFLQIVRPGSAFWLRICLAGVNARFHRSWRGPKKFRKPQRFAEILRSRIRGGRIVGVHQHGSERILVLRVLASGEELLFYARFWGGAANSFLCELDGTILDCQFRRPGRRETSGEVFVLPEIRAKDPAAFPVRAEILEQSADQADGMPFNRQLARYYDAIEGAEDRRVLEAELERRLLARENALAGRVKGLERKLREYEDEPIYQRYGELLSSQLHRVERGQDSAELEDYWNPGQTVQVPLDPRRSPQENSERYFQLAKKARSGIAHAEEEILNLQIQIEQTQDRLSTIQSGSMDIQELEALAEQLRQSLPKQRQSSSEQPGLEYSSGGFRILVGRTAKENDVLLRRYTRGNDLWLHTRDVPGAYVFIKAVKNKTVPLEVLLDAGNLAAYYSKAKGAAHVDLYYTQVKYLRRPREAKLGLVLPTQEKNLAISPDQDRLTRLQSGDRAS